MNGHASRHAAVETLEGVGVTVKRLFPVPGLRNLDPFVLWDHFSVAPDTGFPDHPHRGFEAITYMLEGSMRHTDNLGNQSTVTAGGAQRFTAGRGLVHSEMPGGTGDNTGIQLWINLPRRLKDVAPAYQQVDADAFPVEHFETGWKKTIVGEGSPLQLLSDVRYSELALQAGGHFEEALPKDFTALAYLLQGQARVSGQDIDTGSACFVTGASRIVMDSEAGCRLMLCLGCPHGEPIHQHGPYVD